MTSERRRDIDYGLLAIASVVAASLVGQVATYPNLAPWYANLIKPWFNPPNWIFGPVWTTLYVLMAYALWRILCLPGTDQRSAALAAFFTQLVFNALWPWMFFAANSTALGLVNIVPQLAVILAAIWLFFRIDRLAAWCLVPLGLWVTYAATLNTALWWLNA